MGRYTDEVAKNRLKRVSRALSITGSPRWALLALETRNLFQLQIAALINLHPEFDSFSASQPDFLQLFLPSQLPGQP
jgi:hypothetical protein